MVFDLNSLVRENILGLKPYSSARSEFAGEAEIFLDANENSFGSPAGPGYNRYPDPLQSELREIITLTKGTLPEQTFIGNGSDEVIDLLLRIFCRPGIDEVVICPPTYGMYRVSADINDARVREVPLTKDMQLDVGAVLSVLSPETKLIFVCSPNNPTGNLMRRGDVVKLLESFLGIVVVDEAYIDFSEAPSMIHELPRFPNLVVLQTLSKAWGMAGLRIGTAYAAPEIISLLNAVKPPYNVSSVAQEAAAAALSKIECVNDWIARIVAERKRLLEELTNLKFVRQVYPSDTNFILVQMDAARSVYRYLIREKIVVRDRSSVVLCEGCLRITVGTEGENTRLLTALTTFEESL